MPPQPIWGNGAIGRPIFIVRVFFHEVCVCAGPKDACRTDRIEWERAIRLGYNLQAHQDRSKNILLNHHFPLSLCRLHFVDLSQEVKDISLVVRQAPAYNNRQKASFCFLLKCILKYCAVLNSFII